MRGQQVKIVRQVCLFFLGGIGLLILAALATADAPPGYSAGNCEYYACPYSGIDCTCSYCKADPTSSKKCLTEVNPQQCFIGKDRNGNASWVEGNACVAWVDMASGSGGGFGGGGGTDASGHDPFYCAPEELGSWWCSN
jgi:hypothetical protein